MKRRSGAPTPWRRRPPCTGSPWAFWTVVSLGETVYQTVNWAVNGRMTAKVNSKKWIREIEESATAAGAQVSSSIMKARLAGGLAALAVWTGTAAAPTVTLEVVDFATLPITGLLDGKGQTDGMLAR